MCLLIKSKFPGCVVPIRIFIKTTAASVKYTNEKTTHLLHFFKGWLSMESSFWPSKAYISTTNTNYNYIFLSSTGIWSPVPWHHLDRKQMLFPSDHYAPLIYFSCKMYKENVINQIKFFFKGWYSLRNTSFWPPSMVYISIINYTLH